MTMVSIEISNYNRKDVLRKCLECLAVQTYPVNKFEVVVSDDGSTDGTEEMIEHMKSVMPYEIRFLKHKHLGCGPTHNRGILESRNNIVLMLANDIFAEPNLVEEHVKSHEANPDPCVVVVGSLEQSPESNNGVFQEYWNIRINKMFPKNKEILDYRDFWVSNVSFKRDFMVKYGMFRDFPAASHEDIELGYRLQKQGAKFIFNGRAKGCHFHLEDVETISKRAYMHGYNWYNLEKNVPELWVRVKSGNIDLSDGIWLNMKTKMKNILQFLCLNRFTVMFMMVPLVRSANILRPFGLLVYKLSGAIASYSFRKGLEDYARQQKH